MNHTLRKDGAPVLLADVAPSGVSKIDPNAKSGNPAHDTSTGKFGGTATGKQKAKTPANVDPIEFARMLDAVREAARTFEGNINENNIRQFIANKAAHPDAVNVKQFAQLVTQQHITDLVDIIDNQMGKTKPPVKITAPKSYVSKVLAGLSDDDVSEIVHRLEARGRDSAVIDNFIIGRRLPAERRDAVRAKKDALAASDEWADTDSKVEFVTPAPPPPDPVAFAEAVMQALPAPNVNVTVAQTPVQREVLRDAETGLVTGYRDIPLNDHS